jgi:hypothetical protein
VESLKKKFASQEVEALQVRCRALQQAQQAEQTQQTHPDAEIDCTLMTCPHASVFSLRGQTPLLGGLIECMAGFFAFQLQMQA